MRRLLNELLELVPYAMAAGVCGYMFWLVGGALVDGNWQALWFAPLAGLVLLVGVSYAVEWWEAR